MKPAKIRVEEGQRRENVSGQTNSQSFKNSEGENGLIRDRALAVEMKGVLETGQKKKRKPTKS